MSIAINNTGKKLILKNGKKVLLTPSPTIAPNVCNQVTSGFSASVTSSQATLFWGDSGAVSYNIRYRQLNTTAWSTTVSTSTSTVISNLLPDLDYEWQVQGNCTDLGLIAGWSFTQTFKTLAVSSSSLTASFYRYAQVVDNIKPTDFDLGNISENDLEDKTNFISAKLFCEGDYDRLQSVDYTTSHSGTSRWIKIVSPPGTCCNGSPWFCRIQGYRSSNESSTVIPDFESEEFFMDVTYYFPTTSLNDPGEPDWVASTGGKISPGITGQTGVGVTQGNPQQTGKYEMTFHWYGMQNNKGDYRNSTYTKTNSLTDFHLAASIYAADPRTVINNGSGYQMSLFFCTAGGTSRKVFTVGNEYRFRGWMRTNTPANAGPYDGMLRWECSTNGGAWEELVTVTDFNWRSNYTTKLGQSGFILFRGGGYGWLVGYSNSYPTTIHETNIYMKDYLTGSFPLGNTDPTGTPSDLSNMFSFIPDDSIGNATLTNVKWDIKNATTGATLYTGNGAPQAIAATGNFWHGRWIWPIIDLGPAFVSTSGGNVEVCKTITDSNGNVSNPYCLIFEEDNYESGPLPDVCDAPFSLVSNPAINSVDLIWNGDSDTTSYIVSYRELGTTTYTTVTTAVDSITLTGLLSDTDYEWTVSSDCTNSSSTTSGSTFKTAAVNNTVCDTPTGLSTTSLTDTSASLNWSGNPNATLYTIRYKKTTDTAWSTTTSTVSNKILTGLEAATSYEFQVESTCSSTTSNYSPSTTFTTLAGFTPGNYNVLMSIDDAGSPEPSDAAIRSLLENNGNYTVVYATDNDLEVETAEQYDLVIYGPSSTSHGSSLRWANVNQVFMTHEDMNPMWVANQSTSGGGNGNTITITDNSHPITSQFGVGTLQIFNSSHAQASHSQNAASFKELASNPNNGNTSVAAMEVGGARYEWWSLGRIASLPMSDGGAQDLTTDGERLVIAACDWAASYDTSLAPNIKPYGLVAYNKDNANFHLVASQTLENPDATYLFGHFNPFISSSTQANSFKLSKTSYLTYQGNDLGFNNFNVRMSYNNNEYKIVIFDDSSGFNHNHGDEAEDIYTRLIEQLNVETNSTFSVVRDNNIVKSDDLFDYDMLVIAGSTGSSHFDGDDRERIERFVELGKSVSSIHGASDAYWHSTSNGGNTGVWDYYAENIVGCSVQRNPNHTNNNTNGTLTYQTAPYLDSKSSSMITSNQTSWSHDEEYYYWEDGYIDPKFTEVLRVSSTGSGAQNDARMMAHTYDHPAGGFMFYTALGHNSSTWDSDVRFEDLIKRSLIASWVKTHFTDYREMQGANSTSPSVSDDTGNGTTYYVTPETTGTGDGLTEANAMSFSTAKAQWNGGSSNNTYLFKRDEVFPGTSSGGSDFEVTVSGTAVANELTFGAYGTGAKPRFVGRPEAEYAVMGAGLLTGTAIPLTNTYQLNFNAGLNSGFEIKSLYYSKDGSNWKRVVRARTSYLTPDGFSSTQLTDSGFASEYPLSLSEILDEPTTPPTVHWKADLYTWEWDTVDVGSISGNVYPFVSNNHTTSTSTSYPYYIQNDKTVALLSEGPQDIDMYVRFDEDSVFIRMHEGVDPSDYVWHVVTENTGLSVTGSNIIFKNLDFDGFYQEGVYLGSGVANVQFEDCLLQNCYGAGIYNDFDGEFSVTNCLIHNIDGVGVYINSSQDCSIITSTVSNIGLDGGQIFGVRNIPGKAQNQFHSGITGFGKTTGGMENLLVDKCRVFNIGYNGVRFDGNNNTVSDNYICAAMLELSDGGGIYSYGGNATAYTTNCVVDNNTVVYCPGNLDATNKDPDRNLAEGIYLDNGNDGTQVTNNSIFYAGGWAALNNFDNVDCTWDNNVFFGSSRFGLLTFDQTTSGNNDDNNVTNNYFVVWHPDHSPVISLKRNSPPGYEPVDNSDSNSYIMVYKQRPAHENTAGVGVTYTEWVGYGARYFKTLSQWNSDSGYDGSSNEQLYQKDFITKNEAIENDFLLYVTTDSGAFITVPAGTWKKVDGSTAGATETISTYSSLLLIKQ